MPVPLPGRASRGAGCGALVSKIVSLQLEALRRRRRRGVDGRAVLLAVLAVLGGLFGWLLSGRVSG